MSSSSSAYIIKKKREREKRVIFSTDGAGTTRYAREKDKVRPLPHTLYKVNSVGKSSGCKSPNYETLEENMGRNPNLGLDSGFLDVTPKA